MIDLFRELLGVGYEPASLSILKAKDNGVYTILDMVRLKVIEGETIVDRKVNLNQFFPVSEFGGIIEEILRTGYNVEIKVTT